MKRKVLITILLFAIGFGIGYSASRTDTAVDNYFANQDYVVDTFMSMPSTHLTIVEMVGGNPTEQQLVDFEVCVRDVIRLHEINTGESVTVDNADWNRISVLAVREWFKGRQ